MNLNFIRTILTTLASFYPILVLGLGCTGDNPATVIVEAMSCTNSWLPASSILWVTPILGGLSVILKAFGQGGSVGQNLGSKSVVVTEEAKVGTVTPEQVAAKPMASPMKV